MPGAVRHQLGHERYVCVLRIVNFLAVCIFTNLPCSIRYRCVVNMRSPSAPVSCIVVIQYYGAPNRKQSFLRRPHVAGLLCSENTSSRCMIPNISKSMLSGHQTCAGTVLHQTGHERYVCVLRTLVLFDRLKFSQIGHARSDIVAKWKMRSPSTPVSVSSDSILRRSKP